MCWKQRRLPFGLAPISRESDDRSRLYWWLWTQWEPAARVASCHQPQCARLRRSRLLPAAANRAKLHLRRKPLRLRSLEPFYKTPGQLRGWTHKSLILALLEQTSGHYGLLIDSSKTAWGVLSAPFMLRRNLGLRFHLIHLVRDPRGVCWSSASGAWKQHAWIKNRYLRYLRTALGWWAANLSCELFAKFYPDQYSRVRYEDLVESHVATLDRPFAALHTETIAPPLQTSTAANRHQLYGNHGRYNELRSSEIREDSRWRAEMPSAHRAWGAMISWPLRLSYGY
jgi:hypothetical protein